jgi:hypothetical protein
MRAGKRRSRGRVRSVRTTLWSASRHLRETDRVGLCSIATCARTQFPGEAFIENARELAKSMATAELIHIDIKLGIPRRTSHHGRSQGKEQQPGRGVGVRPASPMPRPRKVSARRALSPCKAAVCLLRKARRQPSARHDRHNESSYKSRAALVSRTTGSAGN